MAQKKKPSKTPSKAAKPKTPPASAEKARRSEASTSVPVDPLEGKIYTTGKWKTLPNYECLWCAFATVDHDSALDHFKSEHESRPVEVRTINTGLVSPDGEPLTRVEPAEED